MNKIEPYRLSMNLNITQKKTIDAYFKRLPWSTAGVNLSKLIGIDVGLGAEATKVKLLEQLQKETNDWTDEISPNTTDMLAKMGKYVVQSLFYCNKACGVFSYNERYDKTVEVFEDRLKKIVQTDVVNTYWTEDEIKNVKPNKVQPVQYNQINKNEFFTLLTSVTLNQKNESVKITEDNADYFPGCKVGDSCQYPVRTKEQKFHLVHFNKITREAHVFTDCGDKASSREINSNFRVLKYFMDENVGIEFLSEPIDLFKKVEQIYKKDTNYLKTVNYRICELAFITNEGTKFHEKKRDSDTDLKDDAFNIAGTAAVGGIQSYRIALRQKRVKEGFPEGVEIELYFPGTLKRLLGGSKKEPLRYAIMSGCMYEKEFFSLFSILKDSGIDYGHYKLCA